MSTVTTSLILRDSEPNTVTSLVDTFNTFHQAVVDSGMIQVAEDEYIGQAGVFSETSGVGETVVTLRRSPISYDVIGYKVYRHPTLPFYIKINYINHIASATVSGAEFSYVLSPALNGAGGFPVSATPEIIGSKPLNGSVSADWYAIDNPIGAAKLVVSCGTDFFWISREVGYKAAALSYQASFANGRFDPLSIGVFSSNKSDSVFCVVLPQQVGSFSGGSGYLSLPVIDRASPIAIRYSVMANGGFTNRADGAAGSLQDSSNYATEAGIRVAQGQLVIDGEQHRFNFGFASLSSIPDSAIVGVNITGVHGRYKSLQVFGCANPTIHNTGYGYKSSVIFPLVG